jgi:hypothetical protein
MSQPKPVPAWTRSRLPRLLAIPALAAAGALLAGCGGSTPASNAANTEQAGEQKAEATFADFAKCLREHGVNAEAQSRPGGGHGLKVSPGSGGPQQAEAAQKACKRYQPEPQKVNLSPQQKVEREEAVRKFAKCMREHGIKVEASTQGGGIQIRIHGHPGEAGAPNPESPAFQKSQSACQKLLPGPPPGRGAGPGKSQSSESSAGVAAGG